MARIFEGQRCPNCAKGTLKGTIKRKSRVLLRCSDCKQVFELKRKSILPKEWQDESEIPIVPKGVFMAFAIRLVDMIRVFGTENVTSRYITIHADDTKIDHPAFEVTWWPNDLSKMNPKVQMDLGIEPVRTIVLTAADPLWMNYGVSMELTKLASDSELPPLLKIMGVKEENES